METFMQHPWGLQISRGGPPLGPNQVRYVETTLRALQDTPADVADQG
jgi:hypothetical protein